MRYICLIIYSMSTSSIFHRLSTTFLGLILTASLNAQEVLKHHTKTISTSDTSLLGIQDMLSSEFGFPVMLKKFSHQKSPIGKHEQFRMFVGGISVHNAMLKRNTYGNNQVKITYPTLPISAKILESVQNLNTRSLPTENIHSFQYIYNSGYQWVLINKTLNPCFLVNGQHEQDHIELIYDLEGSEISRRSLRMYSHPDSTIVVNTFQPDPITNSGSETTFSLLDNNDLNSDRLVELMTTDSIKVRWDSLNKTWKLESDNASAQDIFTPKISPPTSPNGVFSFTRDQDGFEYVNAYFHINKQHQHLQNLGFGELVDYPIHFDAHGSDLEQSFFDPLTDTTGQLAFGDGGVDDAEDADVIIHEYAHAMSYSAAPGTAIGIERLAIEEGLCDFFAVSYSREYSDYQRDIIFNWDGHNDFWSGRELTYSRTYPSDLEGDLYLDAPIWASAIADVYDYYGREVSETIMLTSMYSYFPGMNMTEAAHLYLQADTLLYDAEHSDIISILFCERGLLANCADTLPTDHPPSDPFVANHEAFSLNKGPLIVYPNGNSSLEIELFDIHGKLLESYSFEQEQILYELPEKQLPIGVYILRIRASGTSFSYRVLKLNP